MFYICLSACRTFFYLVDITEKALICNLLCVLICQGGRKSASLVQLNPDELNVPNWVTTSALKPGGGGGGRG